MIHVNSNGKIADGGVRGTRQNKRKKKIIYSNFSTWNDPHSTSPSIHLTKSKYYFTSSNKHLYLGLPKLIDSLLLLPPSHSSSFSTCTSELVFLYFFFFTFPTCLKSITLSIIDFQLFNLFWFHCEFTRNIIMKSFLIAYIEKCV